MEWYVRVDGASVCIVEGVIASFALGVPGDILIRGARSSGSSLSLTALFSHYLTVTMVRVAVIPYPPSGCKVGTASAAEARAE